MNGGQRLGIASHLTPFESIVNQRFPRAKEAHGSPPAIAIIGCGAIAESFNLPALARHPAVLERSILVDRDAERARQLARQYGIARVVADYRDVLKDVDGAVIAVPHHLHHPIALECIRNDVHVLCEKPLAESACQVQEIIDEARKSGVAVLVNNTRRLYPSSTKVHQLIQEGHIGRPRYLEFYEGEEYDWPSASGFYFGSRGSARGVLLDKGAHVLDLVCWWLGGKPRLVSYEDDSLGGSEAVAKLSFEYGDCRCKVHLSWLSKLRNCFRIEGESGSIDGGIYDWRSVSIVSRTGRKTIIRTDSECRTLSDFGKAIIDNFLGVISEGVQPVVSPRDVADSITLIEECYADRSRFEMPWYDTLHRIA